MKTHIIEVTQPYPDRFNWGKFLVGQLDAEWTRRPQVAGLDEQDARLPLLTIIGWHSDPLLVLDLQTGEGALFIPGGGLASADLDKHRIWVCPLFEPFLTWLYKQDLSDLGKLPNAIELHAEPSLYGYRRPGPKRNHRGKGRSNGA